MLETIAVLLIVLWVLGYVSSYTLGGFIHILLVVDHSNTDPCHSRSKPPVAHISFNRIGEIGELVRILCGGALIS